MREAGTDGVERLWAADIGLRRTRQRAAIVATLGGCQDFVSAQELHTLMASSGLSIGLSTVYRTLHDLERVELVDVVRDEAGGRFYRHRPSAGHRHYLICRCCGVSRPVDTDVVERWADGLAEQYGFSDVDHTLELAGICADCSPTVTEEASLCRSHPDRRTCRD